MNALEICHACALQHVQLYRSVRDVFGLCARARLDLHQVVGAVVVADEHVHPRPDALKREGGLVQGLYRLVPHGPRGTLDGLRVPVVLLTDEHAAREALPRQLAHAGAGVQHGLRSLDRAGPRGGGRTSPGIGASGTAGPP